MELPANGVHDLRSIKPPVLPADLEALSLSRFDGLVAKEELIYDSSTAETITDQGFKVCLLPGLHDEG
jgi:hypothetical protein